MRRGPLLRGLFAANAGDKLHDSRAYRATGHSFQACIFCRLDPEALEAGGRIGLQPATFHRHALGHPVHLLLRCRSFHSFSRARTPGSDTGCHCSPGPACDRHQALLGSDLSRLRVPRCSLIPHGASCGRLHGEHALSGGLALYLLFSISTFVGYEIKHSSDAAGQGGPGEEKSLPVQRRDAVEKALLATSLAVALGVVVLASLLFFVLPRYRTGYLTALASQAEHISGFSETVNLGDIRKIKRSSAVVMRVRIEGIPSLFKGVRWRGVGLTSFDGKRWFNDNTDQLPVSPTSPGRFLLPSSEGWQSRGHLALRYRVLLAPLSTDVLFVAAVPRQLTGRIRLLSIDQTQSLHNPQRDNAPFGYDVVTEAGVPAPEQLRRTSTDFPPAIRLAYLRTPGLNPAVANLARQVTASATCNYERASRHPELSAREFWIHTRPDRYRPRRSHRELPAQVQARLLRVFCCCHGLDASHDQHSFPARERLPDRLLQPGW